VCLAFPPPHVVGLKPVKRADQIVVSVLLWHEKSKPVFIRQSRPTGTTIVAGGRLARAMQNHDKSRFIPKVFWQVSQHR
jgi:hypothetical protein